MTGTATTTAPDVREVEQAPAAAAAGAGPADDHLDTLQRVQAEYDNYRRRTRRELGEQLDRGAQQLVERLLPVLDAADRAVEQSPEHVGPLHRVLVETLEAEGLERVSPAGDRFDPAEHHAVEHLPAQPEDEDPSAGGTAGAPVVVDVLRPGYRWRGRLVRPAMVRVQERPAQEV